VSPRAAPIRHLGRASACRNQIQEEVRNFRRFLGRIASDETALRAEVPNGASATEEYGGMFSAEHLVDDITANIISAWDEVAPRLKNDPMELEKRLARRRLKTLRRPLT
jgi:hypothetical protein